MYHTLLMRRFVPWFAVLLPVLACLAAGRLLAGGGAPAPRDKRAVLRFGKIPSLNARDMISGHERLMRYLSERREELLPDERAEAEQVLGEMRDRYGYAPECTREAIALLQRTRYA